MVSTPRGPTILITDGWLANAGDAASYIATTRSLQRALPGARVAISAHQRRMVGHLYPELDLVPPLDALTGSTWPWTTDEDSAERDVIERVVDQADLVIAAGGGYLLERYRPEARIRGFEALLERGKRLVFYSQSIGRFRDPGLRDRLQAVLRAADLVLVRDEISLEIVHEQRDSDGVHLTADEAFLFPSSRRIARSRSLMVTPSPHPWERSGDNELPDQSFIPEVANALARVLESGLARTITLASTAQGLGGPDWALEDDSVVSDAIYAAMPAHRRNRVTVRRGYLTPWQYAALAAEHTALISMRMHGAILAGTARTPALMANASDKARELARRTEGGIGGISDRSEIARIDELVRPLLEEPGLARVRQNGAVDEMRRLAGRNAQLVAERI